MPESISKSNLQKCLLLKGVTNFFGMINENVLQLSTLNNNFRHDYKNKPNEKN